MSQLKLLDSVGVQDYAAGKPHPVGQPSQAQLLPALLSAAATAIAAATAAAKSC